MGADPAYRRQLQQRISLPDLMSSHVHLSGSGIHLRGPCPTHRDLARSLHVDPASGSFLCYACAWSGDAVTWTMAMEHLDEGVATSLLARRAGMPPPATT